jgi:hypothetical protein
MGALTAAVNDVGVMVVAPESIEKPIDAAGFEAQVAVLAVSWKGEVTWAPLAGVVTVIAYPGTTPAINNDKEQRSRFIDPPKTEIFLRQRKIPSLDPTRRSLVASDLHRHLETRNPSRAIKTHGDAQNLEAARSRNIQMCMIQVQEKNRLYLYVRGYAYSQ